jgi:hypothetical protein
MYTISAFVLRLSNPCRIGLNVWLCSCLNVRPDPASPAPSGRVGVGVLAAHGVFLLFLDGDGGAAAAEGEASLTGGKLGANTDCDYAYVMGGRAETKVC